MADNREFIRSIQEATLRIITEETSKMNKACLAIESDAKKNCPKDLGILSASITSEVSVDSSEIVGAIGSNMEYAPYVHNGTGIYAKDGNGRKTPWRYTVKSGKYKGTHWTLGQRPQPFLEDAKLENKDKVLRILGGS